jgi:glutamyl-Q tRNA(Asp) synthetase
MLRTLDACGFEWDGEVVYQSSRRASYAEALAALGAAHRTFGCSCSRKDLAGAAEEPQGYPGTCRNGPSRPGPTAQRFRVSDSTVGFDDLFQGSQSFDTRSLGDFVVERRDGVASYQLAVVVDDAWQGVSRVVRGADLITSTPWQIELQDALGLPRPIYGHLPLVTEPDGAKLSKSNRAIPVYRSELPAVSEALTSTLTLLSHPPPAELAQAPIKEVWGWALAHWRPQALAGQKQVELSAKGDRKQK